MRRWNPLSSTLLFSLLLLWLSGRVAAEEIEPLPVDFLEYLSSFESDEDDWTLFADEPDKKLPAKKSGQRQSDQAPPPPRKPPAAAEKP